MKWRELPQQDCPIARSVAVLGDRWTLLVIREVMSGFGRFDRIQSRLGISRRGLAECLDRLVGHDILEKALYQSAPKRYEYRLTAKGRTLYPLMVFLYQWGNRWARLPADSPAFQESFDESDCSHGLGLEDPSGSGGGGATGSR